MAIYHRATITPSKLDLIAAWAPTQWWGPPAGQSLELIGAFRFDDPEGQVGMETHLVTAGDVVFHVPLTYRNAPLEGADDGFAGEMHHSALGTRYVYDGLRDPRFVMMLAAVTLTGQGEAIGMLELDGRWVMMPTPVRIEGGGWATERVAVDGFDLDRDDESGTVLHNDRFDLTVHRRPQAARRPPIALTATWPGASAPLVLAEIADRG